MTHERLRFAVEHEPSDVFKADLLALLKERDELAAATTRYREGLEETQRRVAEYCAALADPRNGAVPACVTCAMVIRDEIRQRYGLDAAAEPKSNGPSLIDEARHDERLKTLEQVRLITTEYATLPRVRQKITELLEEADKEVERG